MIYGDLETYSEVPDPLRGIAPDPLALGQSNNLYGYTLNDPVNNVDPTGEAIIKKIFAIAYEIYKVIKIFGDQIVFGIKKYGGKVIDWFTAQGSKLVNWWNNTARPFVQNTASNFGQRISNSWSSVQEWFRSQLEFTPYWRAGSGIKNALIRLDVYTTDLWLSLLSDNPAPTTKKLKLLDSIRAAISSGNWNALFQLLNSTSDGSDVFLGLLKGWISKFFKDPTFGSEATGAFLKFLSNLSTSVWDDFLDWLDDLFGDECELEN